MVSAPCEAGKKSVIVETLGNFAGLWRKKKVLDVSVFHKTNDEYRDREKVCHMAGERNVRRRLLQWIFSNFASYGNIELLQGLLVLSIRKIKIVNVCELD